jgi:hypothetical protein
MKAPATGGICELAKTSRLRRAKPTATAAENPLQPIYLRRLEPLFGIDGTRTLRELLKSAKHSHGFVGRGYVETCAGTQPVPERGLDRLAMWLAEGVRRTVGR